MGARNVQQLFGLFPFETKSFQSITKCLNAVNVPKLLLERRCLARQWLACHRRKISIEFQRRSSRVVSDESPHDLTGSWLL